MREGKLGLISPSPPGGPWGSVDMIAQFRDSGRAAGGERSATGREEAGEKY
jgi:hypothetical protein